MCRAQCYDGASNMKHEQASNMNKAASEIKASEIKAVSKSSVPALADTINSIILMSDTLDHCLEIRKLIKASPRRDAILAN